MLNKRKLAIASSEQNGSLAWKCLLFTLSHLLLIHQFKLEVTKFQALWKRSLIRALATSVDLSFLWEVKRKDRVGSSSDTLDRHGGPDKDRSGQMNTLLKSWHFFIMSSGAGWSLAPATPPSPLSPHRSGK